MHPNIIPVEFPNPLSIAAFKAMLHSPENQQAQHIRDIIHSPGGTVSELERACARAPFFDAVVARAPLHPRSRAVRAYLLDETYDRGEVPMTVERQETCVITTIGERSPEPDWRRRVTLFEWMSRQGFRGGTNGWRGNLLSAIMSGACYHPDDPIAYAYARALVTTGRIELAKWAAHNYQWLGSLAKLAVVERLGLCLDTPELLDNAVRYLGCSPNSGETEEERGEVVSRLLDFGAQIKRKSLQAFLQSPDSTSCHGREYAAKHGLMERLKAAVFENFLN